MFFKLKVLVPDATNALIKAMRRRGLHTYVSTARKALLVSLKDDRPFSHATYPNEWRKKAYAAGFSYMGDFSQGGIVHLAFNFPPELNDVNYKLLCEGAERHNRNSYSQVITNYSGGKPRAFRRETTPGEPYCAAIIFRSGAMGSVRLDVEKGYLVIRRASLRHTTDFAIMQVEQVGELLRIKQPEFWNPSLAPLPDKLKHWQEAIKASYDRHSCVAPSCPGHYYRV